MKILFALLLTLAMVANSFACSKIITRTAEDLEEYYVRLMVDSLQEPKNSCNTQYISFTIRNIEYKNVNLERLLKKFHAVISLHNLYNEQLQLDELKYKELNGTYAQISVQSKNVKDLDKSCLIK